MDPYFIWIHSLPPFISSYPASFLDKWQGAKSVTWSKSSAKTMAQTAAPKCRPKPQRCPSQNQQTEGSPYPTKREEIGKSWTQKCPGTDILVIRRVLHYMIYVTFKNWLDLYCFLPNIYHIKINPNFQNHLTYPQCMHHSKVTVPTLPSLSNSPLLCLAERE